MKSLKARINAFTLIELLIVVAIIAILAAIAVPNFLEAQTRAKVARVLADTRAISTAHELYFVDNGTYFCYSNNSAGYSDRYVYNLTTPIAYINTIPGDPFGEREYQGQYREPTLEFGIGKAGAYGMDGYPKDIYNTYLIESAGPDKVDDTNGTENEGLDLLSSRYPWIALDASTGTQAKLMAIVYDPTNGTKSRGQIFRAGGVAPGDTPAHQSWFNSVSK